MHGLTPQRWRCELDEEVNGNRHVFDIDRNRRAGNGRQNGTEQVHSKVLHEGFVGAHSHVGEISDIPGARVAPPIESRIQRG